MGGTVHLVIRLLLVSFLKRQQATQLALDLLGLFDFRTQLQVINWPVRADRMNECTKRETWKLLTSEQQGN